MPLSYLRVEDVHNGENGGRGMCTTVRMEEERVCTTWNREKEEGVHNVEQGGRRDVHTSDQEGRGMCTTVSRREEMCTTVSRRGECAPL